MTTGVTPKPRALKMLNGRHPGVDSGGRKIGKAPGYVRLPPVAPDWLPNEARAEWERVVPELQRLQLTKPIDAAAFTAYVVCWDRFVEASRLVAAEGLLVDGRFGDQVRHPALAVAESASKELRGWCAEFGLTPSAEQKVVTPEVADVADVSFG